MKYRNKPTEVDGIRFASRKEANRYKELRLLEKAGEIQDLKLQPSYEFSIDKWPLRYPSGRLVKYVADFSYLERIGKSINYNHVVEDVKGIQTPAFKLKWALMKAVYGIEVRIT